MTRENEEEVEHRNQEADEAWKEYDLARNFG